MPDTTSRGHLPVMHPSPALTALGLPHQVLTLGDSLEGKGFCTGDPADTGEFEQTGYRWSIYARDLLGPAFGDWRNYGVPGASMVEMTTADMQAVLALRDATAYPGRFLVYLGRGINDIILLNKTASEIYEAKKARIAELKAGGAYVLISTHTLTSYQPADGRSTRQVEATIQELNELYRTNQATLRYDGLMDPAARRTLQDPHGPAFQDGLHRTNYGNQEVAAAALPLFRGVGAAGYVPYLHPSPALGLGS